MSFNQIQAVLKTVKKWARKLKSELLVLYYSYKDKRVPWNAKLIAILVVGYAFSPIDLIPDFIPILGYLDDIILLPLGIALAIKLIPDHVFQEYQVKVNEKEGKEKPRNWIAGLIVLVIWLLVISGLAYYLYKTFN
ncbi:YkvA family protein [Alkalihalobacillus sp. AL-G]|uniref:YkvA family protein n=1 Tax=Alkalihalobacillus sp. AL-G TaxID=2926399 RepID=UPI00272C8DA1|nr:YkvA family protein [Alkalihalobacillus sp. AL-G]WLD93092.1 YkvA family protein [Alkalihalobacillus sp. AL-G]